MFPKKNIKINKLRVSDYVKQHNQLVNLNPLSAKSLSFRKNKERLMVEKTISESNDVFNCF